MAGHERLELSTLEREQLRIDFYRVVCRGHNMGPWNWQIIGALYYRKVKDNEES